MPNHRSRNYGCIVVSGVGLVDVIGDGVITGCMAATAAGGGDMDGDSDVMGEAMGDSIGDADGMV
jgi:hypothetical protein